MFRSSELCFHKCWKTEPSEQFQIITTHNLSTLWCVLLCLLGHVLVVLSRSSSWLESVPTTTSGPGQACTGNLLPQPNKMHLAVHTACLCLRGCRFCAAPGPKSFARRIKTKNRLLSSTSTCTTVNFFLWNAPQLMSQAQKVPFIDPLTCPFRCQNR